ncbi:MAG: phosphohydrolase [Oscillospiraceae bacterium]
MTDKSMIRTFSGIFFSPLSPSPEDIAPVDIAHALSLLCRANGHFRSFYSVGQHCLSCEREACAAGLPRETRLACLLHDASEAYISDITRPVKLGLPEYRVIEKRLQDTIYRRFGIDPADDTVMREVARIDDAMLYHEFLTQTGYPLYDSAPEILTTPDFGFVPFEETEKQYMRTLNELYMEETT